MLNIAQLKTILAEKCAAQVDGESYGLEEERKFVLMLQQAQGITQISRVKQITFMGDLIGVSSDDEVYYISADCVFGIKGSNPERDRDEHRPGFRR